MWESDYKESWAPKNWFFRTVVLEKTLENPLDGREIQPVNPEGNQSWLFIGRTDAEAEVPILWSPDVKKWLMEKTLMLGKIEGRKRRGWQRMKWLYSIIDLMDMSLSKHRELLMEGKPGMLQGYRVRHARLNWTEFSQSVSRVQPTTILSILYIKYMHVLYSISM